MATWLNGIEKRPRSSTAFLILLLAGGLVELHYFFRLQRAWRMLEEERLRRKLRGFDGSTTADVSCSTSAHLPATSTPRPLTSADPTCCPPRFFYRRRYIFSSLRRSRNRAFKKERVKRPLISSHSASNLSLMHERRTSSSQQELPPQSPKTTAAVAPAATPPPPPSPQSLPPLSTSPPKPDSIDYLVWRQLEDSRYAYEGRIGIGGFSRVYLVRRRCDQQRLAMKVMRWSHPPPATSLAGLSSPAASTTGGGSTHSSSHTRAGETKSMQDRRRMEAARRDKALALRECEILTRVQGHENIVRVVDVLFQTAMVEEKEDDEATETRSTASDAAPAPEAAALGPSGATRREVCSHIIPPPPPLPSPPRYPPSCLAVERYGPTPSTSSRLSSNASSFKNGESEPLMLLKTCACEEHDACERGELTTTPVPLTVRPKPRPPHAAPTIAPYLATPAASKPGERRTTTAPTSSGAPASIAVTPPTLPPSLGTFLSVSPPTTITSLDAACRGDRRGASYMPNSNSYFYLQQHQQPKIPVGAGKKKLMVQYPKEERKEDKMYGRKAPLTLPKVESHVSTPPSTPSTIPASSSWNPSVAPTPAPHRSGLAVEGLMMMLVEYYPLGDLRHYVLQHQRGEATAALTESQLLSIAYQLACALDFLHSKSPPVIHRDVKPENILIRGFPARKYLGEAAVEKMDEVVLELDEGGTMRAAASSPYKFTDPMIPIVLSDFGLAIEYVPDGEEDAESLKGKRCGTRPYMAPEVFHSEATPASDVWSLGCTLFALATEKLDRREVTLMYREAALRGSGDHSGFAPMVLSALLQRGFSLEFASFVVSLLMVDPQKRPTARALRTYFWKSANRIEFDYSSPFFTHVTDL